MLNAGQFSLMLTDNDIVSKLAHWRLLHSLPSIFQCTIQQISTLPSLVKRAEKAMIKPEKLFKDIETATYAYTFLKQLPVGQAPDGKLVAELQQNPHIDSGEALLIALALTHQDSMIATGDKRAIESIGALQSRGELLGLCGRIICLEQILKCLVHCLGFSAVQAGIRNLPGIDASTRAIWGSRIDAPETSVYEGMQSYITNMKSLAPQLLIE